MCVHTWVKTYTYVCMHKYIHFHIFHLYIFDAFFPFITDSKQIRESLHVCHVMCVCVCVKYSQHFVPALIL